MDSGRCAGGGSWRYGHWFVLGTIVSQHRQLDSVLRGHICPGNEADCGETDLFGLLEQLYSVVGLEPNVVVH